ncbi:MAG: hypothetical protein GDA43_19160 [Hormoscilla sp. SP5CHS1]|nr:hypothetical protein [Hormoscilla sp. SP5CHS1]
MIADQCHEILYEKIVSHAYRTPEAIAIGPVRSGGSGRRSLVEKHLPSIRSALAKSI